MANLHTFTIVDRPLWFHTAGLSETATGYGRRLRSSRCLVDARGRVRRIYITQFSNAGTAWIIVAGRRYVVDAWEGDATVTIDLDRPWGS